MTGYRFYIPPERISGKRVLFPDGERNHLIEFLRCGEKDEVLVTDGKGRLFRVVLEKVSSHRAVGIIKELVTEREPPTPFITLACGIIEGKRFEVLVDSATQLGVGAFLPLACDYSTVEWKGDTYRRKLERLGRIVINSMKHSLRLHLPQIFPASKLEDVNFSRYSTILYGDYEGVPSLVSFGKEVRAGEVFLAVGPDGGFSHREKEILASRYAIPIHLGYNRLRPEVAAIALLVKFQIKAGNI